MSNILRVNFATHRILTLCLLTAVASWLVPGAADADWQCWTSWSGFTNQRTMQDTRGECACGIPFHSCGHSWVDIVGGISSQCNDHSRSFKGWTGGGCETGGGQCEWDMCDPFQYQQSFSREAIEGVNQAWDRFPQIYGCPPPPTVWMNNPFFTVYDLDRCWNKQLTGTLSFASFALQGQLLYGDCSDPYNSPTVAYRFTGSDGVRCCGGQPVHRSNQEWFYTSSCNQYGGSDCSSGGEDCWCDCNFACDTCQPGQSCHCPAGCQCSCSSWSCNPWDTDEWGNGRCERTVWASKYPSCQGGDTNGLLCSDLEVQGDYYCSWVE